ncbi:hypothetical protein NC652_028651 [Populus alba x Populus x berolinensis]|nr:hypothetical protein NC652_028651 [Populus alba x Populus x berolinensis]
MSYALAIFWESNIKQNPGRPKSQSDVGFQDLIYFQDARSTLCPSNGSLAQMSSIHDEDVYTFFEPELPYDSLAVARTKQNDGLKSPIDRRPSMKLPAVRSVSKSSQGKAQRPLLSPEKRAANHGCASGRRPSAEKISWNVLDLKGDNYFSCAVGRTRTNARYLLGSSDDVVSFLTKLANAST